MSYSLSKMINDPTEFPPPPQWLVWVASYQYNRAQQRHDVAREGQVRHVPDLNKAKRRVSDYTSYDADNGRHQREIFGADWAIYEWDQRKKTYVLRYEGATGELRSTNDLFAKPLPGGEKHTPRRALDLEIEEAIASITETIQLPTSVRT